MIKKLNYKSEDKNDMDNILIYKLNEVIGWINAKDKVESCDHDWNINETNKICMRCGKREPLYK